MLKLDDYLHLGENCSFFGNVAFNTLWECFSIKQKEGKHTTLRSANFVLETKIGAKWETDIRGGKYCFFLRVAWEQQIWFDQNHPLMLDCNKKLEEKKLVLQGLTPSAGFEF